VSRPPPDWHRSLQTGVGEGIVIGEVKSRYIDLLSMLYDLAEKRQQPYTVVLMDVIEAYLKSQGVKVE